MRDFFRLKLDPWGLLATTGAAACLFTVTGFCGQLWWAFDLTSHFRVQYAVGLLLIAGVLGVARRWKTALVFAVFATLNCAVVVPYCYTGRPAASPPTQTLRLLLLNVHTENRRSDLVEAVIREMNPDVVLLEEVSEPWLEALAGLRTAYPHEIAQPREDNFGIALFSRRPLAKAEVVALGEAEVPSLLAEVRVGSSPVQILGTHPLPPAGRSYSHLRNGQLRAVAQLARDRSLPVVVLGDLNVTPWSPHFRDLRRNGGLEDSARGFGWQTTWPAFLFPMRIAIDHCLVSPELRVLRREVGRSVGSDHLPLLVQIALPQ